MTGVEIDAGGRRARVQAGALWQDVVPQASDMGLAALHGSSPDVGIVGYSLGGGIGYLGRRYGIQTNSVTAIEIVTADGELLEATPEREPELFWALRGGGGNFGVVTAIEFRLYPVDAVYAGMMIWPWEQGQDVFSRWVEWTRQVPDEVTSMARLMQIPDMDGVPDLIRGRQIAIVNAAFLGDEEEGRRILAPLRELRPEADLFGMMPPVGLSSLHGDPEEPVPAASDMLLLDSLPEAAIDTLVATAGPGSGSTLLMAELRHLGGAIGRGGEGHGALARLEGDYLLFGAGVAADADIGAAVQRDATGLVEAMAPFGSGHRYLNFTEHRVDTRAAFPPETYERLQRVRQQYDPEALFNANHQIM